MRILAIETSCDETALSILEFKESDSSVSGKVLSHLVSSQIEMHKEWGGVVPNIAKREHQRALIPLLKQALTESSLLNTPTQKEHPYILENVRMLSTILDREPELLEQAKEFLPTIARPEIDLIAVTHGPGLEPALWVGINFAKALAMVWNKPLLPISHMEGHLFSALLKTDSKVKNQKEKVDFELAPVEYPAVGLLISGGHTELIEINAPLSYTLLGQTRDDAVGEAFDKVARILGLPYPGGPQISKLAEKFSSDSKLMASNFELPRPMLKSNDLDFSFSGLKTAVLYLTKKLGELTEAQKTEIAFEFEEAATEVILTKTKKAIEQTGAKSLLVGGGVIANKRIRSELEKMTAEIGATLYLPESWLTGDNATMIALAAYTRAKKGSPMTTEVIEASGTLSLHSSL